MMNLQMLSPSLCGSSSKAVAWTPPPHSGRSSIPLQLTGCKPYIQHCPHLFRSLVNPVEDTAASYIAVHQ